MSDLRHAGSKSRQQISSGLSQLVTEVLLADDPLSGAAPL